ncbi:MAG: acyltransferase family protein [Clostridiales bacterium]|nr:acyltransferase family protein [Clostridiales bacterium]
MKQRNGKIELMRFVFALCILFFHVSESIWDNNLSLFGNFAFFATGNFAVEFFLFVSGFLMAKSLASQLRREEAGLEKKPDNLADPTLRFLWGKIKSFIAYLWIFSAGTIVLLCITRTDKLPGIILERLPSLFLLTRTGIMGDSASFVGVDWYLSSMILTMAILYPLCRRYGKTFTRLVAPLSGLLIMGFMMYTQGTLGNSKLWTGLTFHCNLRALADMCLGIGAYEVCEWMRQQDFTRIQRLALSATEAVCYLLSLCYICSFSSSDYWGVLALVLLVGITISFSQKGLLGESRLFQNRICNYLGAISLPVFLSHRLVRDTVLYFLPDLRGKWQCLLILLLTLAVSALTYGIITTIRSRRAQKLRA